ncbi:MAG: HAMP domain-containing histidine kinase [Anaerolineae bacterium]|nr:HAMP domain-containing histidine kinase [Anaerolineae bacterium]
MTRYKQWYIGAVSLIGVGLVVWALVTPTTWENIPLLLGFIVLAALSQVVSTISARSGITFSVSQAIGLAVVAVLNPAAAVLVAAVDGMAIWVINAIRDDKRVWKGSFEQLVFNSGMIVIATFVAGMTFVGLQRAFSAETPFTQFLTWVVAAIVLDQVNVWLVAVVIALQHNVSPLQFWLQQRWAMPINVMIIVGGGILVAYGADKLGIGGLVLIALPVMLLAYPFRIYIKHKEAQLAALDKANEELRAVNVAIERLLAVISHDMRTQIGTIRLYANLLLDSGQKLDEAKQERMLHAIINSEETLARIVDNIVELERIRSGQTLELHLDSVDLLDVIRRALYSVEAHANDKQIALSVQDSPDPVLIEADAEKMTRVFQNLLSNAIKYSPEGAAVSVSVAQGDQLATVAVSDTGFGIPEEELATVFEPYRRVEANSRASGGSGLGLAIVKEYVLAHHGRVDVSSKQGVGTTFTVEIPLSNGFGSVAESDHPTISPLSV